MLECRTCSLGPQRERDVFPVPPQGNLIETRRAAEPAILPAQKHEIIAAEAQPAQETKPAEAKPGAK